MKIINVVIIIVVFISCKPKDILGTMNANEVITASKKYHDPQSIWNKSLVELRIQEPRIKNPVRYSNVQMDNKTGEFLLERNRGVHIVSYIIDSKGVCKRSFRWGRGKRSSSC